jgi:hypothetical protein
LDPPTSAEINAEQRTPRVSSTARKARKHSWPYLIFSMRMTGAPMLPTDPIQSSSPIASSSRIFPPKRLGGATRGL